MKFERAFKKIHQANRARLHKNEYLDPGAKPVVEPPVITPKLFVEETRILTFFLLNIIDTTIDKAKIKKKKLENQQVPEQYVINRVIRPPRKPASVVASFLGDRKGIVLT